MAEMKAEVKSEIKIDKGDVYDFIPQCVGNVIV